MDPQRHRFCYIYLRLIVHGELLCLFHVDDTCLDQYPCTIVHITSPCKHVIIYPQGQFFGLSHCKSHRAILCTNSGVLDGATTSPLMLHFFRLIVLGEFLCLFHVDDTCLEQYSFPSPSHQCPIHYICPICPIFPVTNQCT